MPNDKLGGVSTTAAIPVPVRVTVGLTLALSLTVRVPDREPKAAGLKVTEIVQLDPALRVFGLIGQVVVLE